MNNQYKDSEDRYEIIIKKFGQSDTIETSVMGDRQTQEILRLIGLLNVRNALGKFDEECS